MTYTDKIYVLSTTHVGARENVNKLNLALILGIIVPVVAVFFLIVLVTAVFILINCRKRKSRGMYVIFYYRLSELLMQKHLKIIDNACSYIIIMLIRYYSTIT